MAAACDLASQPVALHLVYPNRTEVNESVKVRVLLAQATLNVHFDVSTPNPINDPRALKAKQYPFQFDVVELFLSVTGAAGDRRPYYEMEVTPNNQTFYVLVDNHKVFHNGVPLGARTSTHQSGTAWSADLQIPLGNLNWNGDPANLVGNAFAILGKNRSYWSLALPVTAEKPNFHQPEYFTSLACVPVTAPNAQKSGAAAPQP